MANKQYISIIRLFEHCDISVEENIQVSRIKKQLAAEFDLGTSGFIETEGYSYNKQDVFEEVEKPDFIGRLHYHQLLWNRKVLLAMLEDNVVDLPGIDKDFKSFQNDPSFDQFFSPYFGFSFNYISRSFLNELKLDELSEWLCYEDFLLPEDREEGFRAIRIFLEDNIRLLRNINTTSYKPVRAKVIHWGENGASRFLNNLPDDFYAAKNEIVLYLINLTVRIQKTYKKDCKHLSTELTCLRDLPEETANLIYNNHRAYTQSRVTFRGNYSWLIWVAFILIRILAGC
ncbi:MAG: hypothetical protein ABIP30_15005 [Ferruginibacter sp.]